MIYICIEDVEKILAVMKKFSDAESFYLENHNSSGIGSIVELTVKTNVHGQEGNFKVEISREVGNFW